MCSGALIVHDLIGWETGRELNLFNAEISARIVVIAIASEVCN